MRTSILFVLLVLTAALAALAVPALADDIDPDTLRVAEMWEIDGLDPAKEGTFAKEKALIAETLVDAAPDFSLMPRLAESWTMDGPTEWTFTLRPGVVFHNGEALTAALAARSLERAMALNPAVGELTKIQSVEAVDDLTLRITTTELYPVLPAALVYADTAIVHPDSPANDQGIVMAPIGTGPYRLAEWRQARQEVALKRNDAYWGEKPGIANVLYRSIPDPATRSLEIRKGSVDFIADAPYGDLDMLRGKGLDVTIASTARVYQVNFGSLAGTAFADKRVREALSRGINREDIVQYILFGMGKPAAGAYEDTMVFANAGLKPHAYEPERAKALLDEAGWTDHDGDGVRDRDGEPLAFTLFTYPQRPGLKPMAMAMQQMWADIGVKADVRILDWSAIEEAMAPGDIRLAAFATAMIPDPDYFLRRTYATDGGNNTWGYSNPELDALLDAGMAETDPAKRLDIYKRAQAIAYDDLPLIHVSYYGVNVVTKPEVEGFVFNPVAHDYMLNTGMHIQP